MIEVDLDKYMPLKKPLGPVPAEVRRRLGEAIRNHDRIKFLTDRVDDKADNAVGLRSTLASWAIKHLGRPVEFGRKTSQKAKRVEQKEKADGQDQGR